MTGRSHRLTVPQVGKRTAELGPRPVGQGRRGLLSRLGFVAAAPFLADSYAEAKTGTDPSQLLGYGVSNVLAAGAAGDGVHDDTPAFQRAIAGTPLNGVILVPRPQKAYRVTRPITLASRSLVGIGWPIIVFEPANPTMDLVEISVETGTYDDWHQGGLVSSLILAASGKGRDLVRILGSNAPQLRDLRLIGAGRDGLHVEGVSDGSWTESLSASNVFVSGSGRDNFHLAVPEHHSVTFVNQSTFLNCKSRAPGRYALACVNRSRRGDANCKISEISWINGELDGSGGDADDIVLLQTLGPGAVECLNFYDVAIEDDHVAHKGYAIKADAQGGGRVGPVYTHDCIAYGAAGGLFSGGGELAVRGDQNFGAVSSRLCSSNGRTAVLASTEVAVIAATNPDAVLKVFVSAAAPLRAYGEWTVFGGIVSPVASTACALAADNYNLLVANHSDRSAEFDWYMQVIR